MKEFAIEDPEFFKIYVFILSKLPEIQNDSALRSCAKICEMLCKSHYILEYIHGGVLNEEKRKIMAACCFDWFITDKKVACQAPAMTCLYYLGGDKTGS